MRMRQQGGFVLVVSVMMLLIMTIMGLGLIRFTENEIKKIDQLENAADLLYSSENCVVEALNLLEKLGKTTPPCESQESMKACLSVNNKMSVWNQSTDGSKLQTKSNNLSYKCTIFPLSREIAEGGGAGHEVGQQNVYGQVATSTKYLYLIESESTNLNDSSGKKVKVDVVASMVY